MKRSYWLIPILAISILGCSKFRDDVKTCWTDPVCRESELKKAEERGRQAGDLAGLSGVPWASKAAKPIVAYTSLLFGLAAAGRKKKKENGDV